MSRPCERCRAVIDDDDWPYGWCESCCNDDLATCRHGNRPEDCNDCFIESDIAYDGGRYSVMPDPVPLRKIVEDSQEVLTRIDPDAYGSPATCEHCKWWIEDEHTNAPGPQKECRNETFLHEAGVRSAGDPAKSLTYEYYEGGQIWTGPCFGCVHFEKNS